MRTTHVEAPGSHGWRETIARSWPLALLVGLLAAAALLPKVMQDPAYHGFADQRAWLGIPRAADVFSNLGFALIGLIGLVRLASSDRARYRVETERALWLVAAGLIGTAAGSAWYHLDPSNASLFWDRLPMTLVFAAIVCAALAQRVPRLHLRWALPLLVAFGIASVLYWKVTGNLMLYVLLQFGGIATLLVLLVATRKVGDPFPWAWVIAWYALAKIAETCDRAIWDATQGLIAGHAIKHLFAAMACGAALWPLVASRSAATRTR